jgi:hypothetical protein
MARKSRDPNSDVSFKILKVFRSDKVDERNAMDLMAIVWTRCGKPVLEKRRSYCCKNGDVRLRKLVGMNADDIRFILAHAEEISQLLNP